MDRRRTDGRRHRDRRRCLGLCGKDKEIQRCRARSRQPETPARVREKALDPQVHMHQPSCGSIQRRRCLLQSERFWRPPPLRNRRLSHRERKRYSTGCVLNRRVWALSLAPSRSWEHWLIRKESSRTFEVAESFRCRPLPDWRFADRNLIHWSCTTRLRWLTGSSLNREHLRRSHSRRTALRARGRLEGRCLLRQ